MTTISDERLAEIVADKDNFYRDEIKSMARELQSLRAQGGMRVKPLVWPDEIRRGQRVMSGHGLIQYTICHYGGDDPNGSTVYRWAAQNEGWHGPLFSYQDAIEAAQADYERRIMGALEASPAPVSEEMWQSISCAPEDEHVILCTTGGHVGEALMLHDEDTGAQKWTWALGPVHPSHTPLGWQPMPKPISKEI